MSQFCTCRESSAVNGDYLWILGNTIPPQIRFRIIFAQQEVPRSCSSTGCDASWHRRCLGGFPLGSVSGYTVFVWRKASFMHYACCIWLKNHMWQNIKGDVSETHMDVMMDIVTTLQCDALHNGIKTFYIPVFRRYYGMALSVRPSVRSSVRPSDC